jgi:hypothetical protein
VCAVGAWYRLLGVLGTLALILTMAFGAVSGGAVVGLAVFLGLIVLGYGLVGYQTWARGLGIGLSALSVLSAGYSLTQGGNPIQGLLMIGWNMAIVGLLVTSTAGEVFSPAYRYEVERTPQLRVRFWTSPLFFVPVGCLLLAFIASR